MPNYHFHALDESGNTRKGNIFAFNESDIELRLSEKGLTLIKSRPLKKRFRFFQLGGQHVKPRFVIEFYYRLSQTLELGLSILKALDENVKSLPSRTLSGILQEIRVAIESGKSFHESVARFPKVFEKLDLAIIKMGEQSGVLPKSLKELARFLEWKDNLRSTIARASIYPAIVFAVIGVVMAVWVGYVLPQLAKFLSEMGIALPRITRVVLMTSEFFQSYWIWIIVSLVSIIGILFLISKNKQGAILLHRYFLKIPVIGKVASNIAVARLSHNFATMYSAGMMINTIFNNLCNQMLGNRYLELQLNKAFGSIQAGKPIADSLEEVNGFPSIMTGAVRNGESTGTIDQAFERLGEYYDREVDRTVEVMNNAIGPLSIVFLGAAFGLILISIFFPLYDVISSFKDAY